MLSATKITSRSFQLYKKNWKVMLLLGLLYVGISAIVEFITAPMDETLGELFASVVFIILSPVLTFGFYHCLLNIWRDRSAAITDVFRFCKSGADFAKTIGFYFCYVCFGVIAAIFIFVVPLFILALFIHSRIVFIAGLLVMVILLMWLVFRLELAEFLYLFRTEEPFTNTIFDGFKMMKGYVAKFLVLQLIIVLLELPYFIPQLILEEGWVNMEFSGIIFTVTFIMEVIIYPMLSIMMAGFFCEVLQEHGVIEDEHAELLAESAESFVLNEDKIQEAVIMEENEEDIYYD